MRGGRKTMEDVRSDVLCTIINASGRSKKKLRQ